MVELQAEVCDVPGVRFPHNTCAHTSAQLDKSRVEKEFA